MSFILDALKKSETERQQQSGPEFSSVPSSAGEPQPLKWLWILAALLGVNAVVLLGILFRPDTSPALPAPDVPAQAEAPRGAATTNLADDEQADKAGFEEQLALARERQADRRQSAASVPASAGAKPASAAPLAATPATIAPSRRVETLDELRLDGQLQLPDLHLDIHVYSDAPAERFVFINMVKHRERSRLDEGPVVSEITPEGVILDYQGRTFLLPRE